MNRSLKWTLGPRITVAIIFILSVEVSALVLEFKSSTSDVLQILSNAISIISTLIVLMISLALYKKYSGSQSIIEKQTETTIQLIKFLTDTSFAAVHHTHDGLQAAMHLSIFEDIDKQISDLDSGEYINLKQKYYFSETFFDLYSVFTKISEDPYLPKMLGDQLKESFQASYFNTIKRDELKTPYQLINVYYPREMHPLKQYDGRTSQYITHIKSKEIDFYATVGGLLSAYKQACSWLEMHNKEVYEQLNINHVK